MGFVHECGGVKAESTRAAKSFGRRIHRLEVLAFVHRDTRIREAADARMRAQDLVQERRPAAMNATNEDKAVIRREHV
jgi:hypothetical protein